MSQDSRYELFSSNSNVFVLLDNLTGEMWRVDPDTGEYREFVKEDRGPQLVDAVEYPS